MTGSNWWSGIDLVDLLVQCLYDDFLGFNDLPLSLESFSLLVVDPGHFINSALPITTDSFLFHKQSAEFLDDWVLIWTIRLSAILGDWHWSAIRVNRLSATRFAALGKWGFTWFDRDSATTLVRTRSIRSPQLHWVEDFPRLA